MDGWGMQTMIMVSALIQIDPKSSWWCGLCKYCISEIFQNKFQVSQQQQNREY